MKRKSLDKCIKFTEKGKHYDEGKGSYQKESDEQYDRLVPDRGESETEQGELVRAINRLYHDYNNNGLGNCYDITSYHSDFDDYDWNSWEIDEYYDGLINHIENYFIKRYEHPLDVIALVHRLRRLIEDVAECACGGFAPSDLFGDDNYQIFDYLCDIITYEIITYPENTKRQ